MYRNPHTAHRTSNYRTTAPHTCTLHCAAQVINILTQHASGKGLFFPEGGLFISMLHRLLVRQRSPLWYMS
jgi:hypothetical protein